MNITQTKLIPTWWVGALALLLILLGTVPLVARFMTLGDEEIRSAYQKGDELSPQQLARFIEGRESASSYFRFATFYNDLAMVAMDRSKKVPEKRGAFLENAAYWQGQALLTSPSDPYGWFRMAHIYDSVQGGQEKAAALWRMSYVTAPYEPRLLLARLAMARRLENQIGDDAPALILQLIRQSWDHNPWHLTRMARDDGFIDLAKEALKDDDEALARFDKILREQLD